MFKSLVVLCAAVQIAPANAEYYLRFNTIAVSNPNCCVSMGQIIFYSNSGAEIDMSGVVATNPGGNNPVNQGPQHVTTAGAPFSSSANWLDFNYGDLILAFPNTVQVASYSFTNAHVNWDRTPVRWRLDASNDGINWTPLDRTYESTAYVLPAISSMIPAISSMSGNCETFVCALGPFSVRLHVPRDRTAGCNGHAPHE
jgi:hypothetical protein|tara:strand:+ start:148 stop:744 length:597 start_codon:yes stop_codon:yes gene_type:complete